MAAVAPAQTQPHRSSFAPIIPPVPPPPPMTSLAFLADDDRDRDHDGTNDSVATSAWTASSSYRSLCASDAKRLSSRLAALDLQSPLLGGGRRSGDDDNRSVSSRSVRRRDVIRPVDGPLDSRGGPPAAGDAVVVAVAEEDASSSASSVSPGGVSSSADRVGEGEGEGVEGAEGAGAGALAAFDRRRRQRRRRHRRGAPRGDHGVDDGDSFLADDDESPASAAVAAAADRGRRRRGRRGVDPDEVPRDGARRRAGDGADPPGEDPNGRPATRPDLVPRGDRAARWADPRTVEDEGEVDLEALRLYEDLAAAASSSSSPGSGGDALVAVADPPSPRRDARRPAPPRPGLAASARELLRNPRMRVATISSGYRKANFFVREDLDTRIYFHQLEDAVGYMARRGYGRMRPEEEREWKELLGRAHGVVKVGPKKEKQRYRKGKLVLVLKKTIRDRDDDVPRGGNGNGNDNNNKKRRSAGGGRRRSSREDESSRAADRTDVSGPSPGRADASPGRSVRGPYGSYSEKFLAQLEEEKRLVLLAVAEGRPLPDFADGGAGGGGGRLLLADGSAGGVAAALRGVDPDADSAAADTDVSDTVISEGNSTLRGGEGDTTAYGACSTFYGADVAESRAAEEDFRKSRANDTVESNRKGVYGGGVRYFVPDSARHDDDDSEEEGTTEDEDFEEEEESERSPRLDEDDDASYDDVTDADGSELGSMVSDGDESTYHHHRNAGVESVTSDNGSR